MPFLPSADPNRIVFERQWAVMSVPHTLYVQYYQQICADSPHKSDMQVRIDAFQAALLHVQLEESKKKPKPRKVHLVRQSGFERALFGAVETTGRMPIVKSNEEEKRRSTG